MGPFFCTKNQKPKYFEEKKFNLRFDEYSFFYIKRAINVEYLTKTECTLVSNTLDLYQKRINLCQYNNFHLLQHFKSVGDVTGRTKCSKS